MEQSPFMLLNRWLGAQYQMHEIKPIYSAVPEPSPQQLARGHGNLWGPEQSLPDLGTPTLALVWQFTQKREILWWDFQWILEKWTWRSLQGSQGSMWVWEKGKPHSILGSVKTSASCGLIHLWSSFSGSREQKCISVWEWKVGAPFIFLEASTNCLCWSTWTLWWCREEAK